MKPSCNKYDRTNKLTAKINRREFLKYSGAAGA
ncbi:MAG: twin-arginine translocation signal domain-containing protein [Deltaproteobacteria bacterium]|nr:twin-arginine translocation signal domain-containing protein [Deltaproteobacteria bacterium]